MALQIGRIPSLLKPSVSLKIGMRRMSTLSLNKQTLSVKKIARDDYLTIVKHVIASGDNQTKNVVVSPPSIHVPLCQCAFPSTGSTRVQLLKYLKSERVEHLEPFYTQIVFTLLADGFHLGGPHLSFMGGIWPDWGHTLKPAIRNTLKALSPRLLFAHCACFIGFWSERFDVKLTTDADFHLSNGTAVRAPFMTSCYKQRVGTFDGFKVLKLPYIAGIDKRRFAMYIYLPDARDGVPSLIERITSELGFVDGHLPHEEAVTLDEFRIPKFKMGFELEVSSIATELGVVDLSERGMAEIHGQPVVCEILHRSMMVVNEISTYTASVELPVVDLGASYPMMGEKSGLRFVADHPFVFTIREDTSGVVLFVGQLLDPLAQAPSGFIAYPITTPPIH